MAVGPSPLSSDELESAEPSRPLWAVEGIMESAADGLSAFRDCAMLNKVVAKAVKRRKSATMLAGWSSHWKSGINSQSH